MLAAATIGDRLRNCSGSDGDGGDFFGYSVAVSGDNFLAGALSSNGSDTAFAKQVRGNRKRCSVCISSKCFFSFCRRGRDQRPERLTAGGAGIRNARLTLVAPNGETRSAVTSSFGFYRFDDVPVGATYVISISAKRYPFSPQSVLVTVSDKISDVDFMGDPQR